MVFDSFFSMVSAFKVDVAYFVVSAFLLGAYQAFLYYKIRNHPHTTIQSVNNLVRTVWVEEFMNLNKFDVIPVQTLRNSTMAATLMASTAVLLIIGVLTLSGQGEKLSHTWTVFNYGGATGSLWTIKLLLLLLDFFVAFFTCSIAVRLYNHVGFMMNIPLKLNYRVVSPRHVANHLNQAGKFYSYGMRAYYFSVPLVFWLFGPQLMLISTVALIVFLYNIDLAPTFVEEEYDGAAVQNKIFLPSRMEIFKEQAVQGFADLVTVLTRNDSQRKL